ADPVAPRDRGPGTHRPGNVRARHRPAAHGQPHDGPHPPAAPVREAGRIRPRRRGGRGDAPRSAGVSADWIGPAAEALARHAERELEALVAVSSPSGDRHGAEEALALCAAFLARTAGTAFAEAALLLVCDEEWRTAPFGHAERFAGWDACLCFEAGQRGPADEEGVVVRRKAAGTLRVTATGASAHSGSAPQ